MHLLKKLFRLRLLPRNILASFRIMQDSRVATWRKVCFLLLGVGYIIWPFDLVADVPFFGQLDDIGVFIAVYVWFMSQIPVEIRKAYGWKEMK